MILSLKCSNCDNIGHTIRSCPEFRDPEKSEDDFLLDSLIYHDDDTFDYAASDWGDDEFEDEEEEEVDEIEVAEDDDDLSYLD